MNRRSFFRRTLGALAAAALAPLLPARPTTILTSPTPLGEIGLVEYGSVVQYESYIYWMANLQCSYPRTSKMMIGITD